MIWRSDLVSRMVVYDRNDRLSLKMHRCAVPEGVHQPADESVPLDLHQSETPLQKIEVEQTEKRKK